MPLRAVPGYRQQLISHVLLELQAQKAREALGDATYQADICDWAQKGFYIPITSRPVVLMPHQKSVMRLFFTRDETHHFPYQTVIYSTIKQSGKSTAGGIAARYFAETQTRFGEIFTVGNDQDQAKLRSFREVRYSIELSPGYNRSNETLPGRWRLNKLSMYNLLTGSDIRAIAVDAAGEAGGKPALSVWTELWGFEDDAAKRFWDELTPVPTIPDSMRMVETYAGYDGESELLQSLYSMGLDGHQMTAGELAARTCRDRPGETFQDLVNGWAESRGDPSVLIPVWINEQASLAMYWDSGQKARRMPWQTPGDPVAEKYYHGQQAILPPAAYRRMHENEWVGAESQFVPIEAWDACGEVHPIKPLNSEDRTPVVIAADAASTGDCFGIVAVTRCPQDPTCVDIRGYKKWDPRDSGGFINYDEPEAFLRLTPKENNVVQIAYDPFQLENMMQKLSRDRVAWCEGFPQGMERNKADRQLYDMILERRVHHSGQEEIREHILNSNAKIQKDEDSKMRIVKKVNNRKIDLAVATSMAVARCLYLNL